VTASPPLPPDPFSEAALASRRPSRRPWRGVTPRARAARRRALLADRVRAPLQRSRRIVVASRKGGVGKTTVALLLGHALAAHRLDRVVAVDGDPEGGTLAHRVERTSDLHVGDLLRQAAEVRGYPALRRFTTQTASGLEVLAAPSDPTGPRPDHASDYLQVLARLHGSYGVIVVDTGTGVLDEVTSGILDAADQLVLVLRPSLDEARAASATLDWLEAQGAARLVADAVVAANRSWPVRGVDVDALLQHFRARCRVVSEVPFDPHLEHGGVVDPDELEPATATAVLELAAHVADGFALDSARRGPRQ
jgi:MinD-like ATPase involved in chromosome partitioning or flagellar assembly